MLFSNASGTFTQIAQILCRKVSLDKFGRIEVKQSLTIPEIYQKSVRIKYYKNTKPFEN